VEVQRSTKFETYETAKNGILRINVQDHGLERTIPSRYLVGCKSLKQRWPSDTKANMSKATVPTQEYVKRFQELFPREARQSQSGECSMARSPQTFQISGQRPLSSILTKARS
jgi:hypothetical protein